MRINIISFIIYFLAVNYSCSQSSKTAVIETEGAVSNLENAETIDAHETFKFIEENAIILQERFPAPLGFKRKKESNRSFAAYLRQLKLQPHGALVSYFDGGKKLNNNVYLAVLDQDIGSQDLHQCADAIMNLYARHHFENKDYGKIHFNFTNGWRCDYTKYAEGYRIFFDGNKTSWIKKKEPSYSLKTFEEYLIWIYKYCGTASLAKELKRVNDLSEIQIGDVLIKGGFPGHAVLVIDMVENEDGNKKFMLAQSYMPAQQMQILKNPINEISNDPWYDLLDLQGETIKTPEWVFKINELMRFEN